MLLVAGLPPPRRRKRGKDSFMVEVEIGSSLVVASCRFPAERAIYFHCFNAMGMGSDRPMPSFIPLPNA